MTSLEGLGSVRQRFALYIDIYLSSTLKQYSEEHFISDVNDFLFLLLTVAYRNILFCDNSFGGQ